jgi:hypothetical protein
MVQDMKMKGLLLCVVFLGVVICPELNAQSIPAAVNRMAKNSLSCDDPHLQSERIGPAKRGYVAVCGDTEIAIFERVRTNFIKVFQSDMPMRAQWSFNRRSTQGYYDFGWVVLMNSGGACVESYRWNGRAYTKILDKC